VGDIETKENEMNMKRFLVIFVVIVALVVSTSSCVRSKVKPIPIGTPSAGGTTVGTVDVMGQLELFVTQTAMAASGKPVGTGVPGAQKTPEATTAPGVPTSTAEPGAPTSTPEVPTEAVATAVPAGPTSTLRPFPTSTPGIPKSYTLQTGEFIYCIARRFNVNPTELLSVNGLGSGSLVFAGMEIKIPQSGNPFPDGRALKPHPTNYTVASGDTLNTIACSFGSADPNTIAAANGLTPPYKLTSGQSLYIP
jgi:LysM repeat protein